MKARITTADGEEREITAPTEADIQAQAGQDDKVDLNVGIERGELERPGQQLLDAHNKDRAQRKTRIQAEIDKGDLAEAILIASEGNDPTLRDIPGR